MPSSDYKLYAANGTEIVTYGTKVINLDIGLRRQFQWPFVIANTNRAIIGADFLNNFGLIIDIKNKRLIDGITNLSIRGVIQSISDMGNISTLNSSSKVSAILTKYPNLCRPPSDFVEAKHSVKHYIPTRGQPIHSKARRLDSQRLTLAKAEFQYMLNNGIIRPSNSPWASPLHLVSKKDESLRPCGDYRRLNAVTLPDRYPIPRLDDFHHILKGTRVYSKIDLCKAFYQIPIAEEDKPKTAIITPFGLFEFNVMSFGLRNATATFQRFMHEVLRNLDFAFVYLDDILVASKTEEEHYSHLETLFSRLNSYGLRINLSKSKFLVQEIDFLGYLITSHGVKPLPTKVKAILEYKKPKTVHELRIFLGMLNFYRTFLNNAAETQAILHEYLRGAKKKDRSEIKWTEEAEVQFEKCKQALANTALLAYPDTELPISLCTDASDRAVGSVLQQLDNNNWKPIAFFSKKLNPAQCNYSTYDRELLAIYFSIKFFKHLLEAREFTILTDHKPLIYAFKQKNEKTSPRQLRHLQYISQFTTDIKYIKGTDNIVADALSRVDAITTIDYEEIAKEQTGDSELQNLISKNTSLKFKQCPLQSGNLLWCDVSTNNIRPFIPIKFRMMVFRNFHELSHPGIKATTKQLTSRFIWPNMNKDIRKWAQACVNCQKCKVSIHTKSEIGKYQEVDERFSVVHIDLIGALPPSNGNIYCLTCIDRYTSWMEVVPLPDMKSETVARAFYENWIVRFGAPHTVISDRGKQFTSQLFKDLTTLCGIKLRHSTAYHPQCNGKIERLHRTSKTAIRAHNSIKWTETLPTVLLGLRAAINKDNNHSLSQMVYGKTIRLPGEFFDDSKHHLHAEEFVQQLQKQMELLKPLNEKHHSKTKVFVHKDLKTCSHVFIRTDRVKKPLEPPYEGPFPVLERTDKYFTLKVKGKNVTTSIDRLRPAYLLADSDNITAEHPTATRPIVSGALPSTSSQQNPYPPDVENAIIELFRRGKRQYEIVRLLKVPQQAVSKAIHRFNEFGHEGDRAGRGRKRTANYMLIKRRLQRYSRVSMRKISLQLLTGENKRVRLERCRQLKHRATDEQWERILFTDEKLFTIEQAYNHQKDRIWSAEAPGTSNNSQSIMTFQQGSASTHKAKLTQDWCSAHFLDSNHFGEIAALLTRSQPDGLQRVVHFAGQGLGYTPRMGPIVAGGPAAHSRKFQVTFGPVYRRQSQLVRPQIYSTLLLASSDRWTYLGDGPQRQTSSAYEAHGPRVKLGVAAERVIRFKYWQTRVRPPLGRASVAYLTTPSNFNCPPSGGGLELSTRTIAPASSRHCNFKNPSARIKACHTTTSVAICTYTDHMTDHQCLDSSQRNNSPKKTSLERCLGNRVCGIKLNKSLSQLETGLSSSGIAIYKDKTLEKISLSHPRHLSVYKSELSAIDMALKDISINLPSKIIIYSDLRAAFILFKASSPVKNLFSRASLAHIGIPGNELADSLAKAGALGLPEARDIHPTRRKRCPPYHQNPMPAGKEI
ncbi:hypothetical protein LAZ67_X001765 [Cordylochernes scorpioides]|uniref:RNA-directed DNA polymerase n=1 Tax=Cordylochernes scorpioides TaxID=51811 RepID=A0ABY6LVA4_9ARAC|nr:hypothetical protein LAZ67_X001765 [Cordylochernes scorpioides]